MIPAIMVSTPSSPKPRPRISVDELKELWGRADAVIEEARREALRPESQKLLRTFTMSEVCQLLDLHPTVFYDTVRQYPDLAGTKVDRQRLFTLAEIHKLQGHLGKLPRQRLGIDRAITISVANFKGGVAKTFTSVTLAQYFALRGYRTLMIDTDPQGSLSTTFGLNPSQVDDWKTVLPYLYGRRMVEQEGLEWPASFRESIDPTYWAGLDIVAANLNLYSGEFALGLRRHVDPEFHFHTPLDEAIEDVRGDYDIIVIDNPPSLSLSTAAAIYAADALIIPAPAETLDFESARAFIKLATEILGAIRNRFGDDKGFEIFRVLITKFQTNSSAHQRLAHRIQQVFGEYCISEPMVQTAAVQSLGNDLKTLYEADPRAKGRGVLKRAIEAANDVNRIIENDVIAVFEARRAERDAARAAAPVSGKAA